MKETLISSKNPSLIALDDSIDLKGIADLHKIYDSEAELDKMNAWNSMPAVAAYTVNGPESKYFIIGNKVVVDAMRFRGDLDYNKMISSKRPIHKGDWVKVYRISTDADLAEARKEKGLLDKPFNSLKTIAEVKKTIRKIAYQAANNQNNYKLVDILNRESNF